MPWVMVQVPEDRVVDVMQYVVQARRPALTPWDEESMARVWNATDGPSRAMLALLAQASLSGHDVEAEACAEHLAVSVRETAALVHELNDFSRAGRRPNLITAERDEVTRPDGTTVEATLLRMTTDLADLVRSVKDAATPPS